MFMSNLTALKDSQVIFLDHSHFYKWGSGFQKGVGAIIIR